VKAGHQYSSAGLRERAAREWPHRRARHGLL